MALEIAGAHVTDEQAISNRQSLTYTTGMLLDKPADNLLFLIEPRLLPKKGRMMISGQSGSCKSLFTLHLAASLATGVKLGSLQVPAPVSVLYVDYELPHAVRTSERLRPISKLYDMRLRDNLFFARVPTRYQLQNRREQGVGLLDQLSELVRKTKPDVLILDPLSSTHAFNENSNEIKQALFSADGIADEYDTAVIVVHHSSTKDGRDRDGHVIEKRANEQLRGHTCLIDWPDLHIHVTKQDVLGGAALLQCAYGKIRWNGNHSGEVLTSPGSFVLRMDFEDMSLR